MSPFVFGVVVDAVTEMARKVKKRKGKNCTEENKK